MNCVDCKYSSEEIKVLSEAPDSGSPRFRTWDEHPRVILRTCKRYPKHIEVFDDHYCYEFVYKPL